MSSMNLGQLISLIHCNKCGMPIEIYPSDTSTICSNCNTVINLVYKTNLEWCTIENGVADE